MPVPAVPSSLLEPVWVEFAAVLPQRPVFDPTHPLGCHRRRVPDRVVFEHLVDALVHGSGYERIATEACSATTIRRRLKQWSAAGLAQKIHAIALAAYDRIIGMQLTDITADGCITKAPCGGDTAGPSPVDRRKQGLKRSVSTEGAGVPLGIAAAGANRHDSPLLGPTLHAATSQVGPHWPTNVTVHLDAGYDSGVTRTLLTEHNLHGEITPKGVATPIQNTKRWVCERTHSWMNSYGKLRRCTDRDSTVIDFYLYLAATFVTVRALIREARTRYRWHTRPTTRRLK